MNIVYEPEDLDHTSHAESDHDAICCSVVNLDPGRTREKQLADLIHELDHAWVEYKEHLIDWITHRETR